MHGFAWDTLLDLDLLSFQSLRASLMRLEKARRMIDLEVATAASQAGQTSVEPYKTLRKHFSPEQRSSQEGKAWVQQLMAEKEAMVKAAEAAGN